MNTMLIIGIIFGVLGVIGMFGVLVYGNKLYNQAEDKTKKIAMPTTCKIILIAATILLVAGLGLGVFGAIQGGSYKNFEGPVATGVECVYRITKVSSDLQISISLISST